MISPNIDEGLQAASAAKSARDALARFGELRRQAVEPIGAPVVQFATDCSIQG